MSLDIHWGILSIVKLVLYIPISILVLWICLKRNTKTGWLFLFIFSLARIAGSALMIAAQELSPVVDNLYLAGYAIDAAGFSLLLVCTLGLLEVIAEGPRGQKMIFRTLSVYILGAAAMGDIIGAVIKLGGIQLLIGTALLVALWALLMSIVLVMWSRLHMLMEYRRKLLAAVTIALPFLAVRTAYSMLSVIPPLTLFSVTVGYPPWVIPNGYVKLEQFDMFTGSWQLYLVMAVLMEFVTVVIYIVAGLTLPLEQDYLQGRAL